MAHWMKDVLGDLARFCEENQLTEIQRSIVETEKILDRELQVREDAGIQANAPQNCASP